MAEVLASVINLVLSYRTLKGILYIQWLKFFTSVINLGVSYTILKGILYIQWLKFFSYSN